MEPINNTNTEKTKKIGSSQTFKFNPFDKQFHANPYPTYHRLRSEDPLHRFFLGGDWVLTRYADVKVVLRSGRVRSHDLSESIQKKNQYLQDKGKNLNALVDISNKFLFYMNPPDHTRLRFNYRSSKSAF